MRYLLGLLFVFNGSFSFSQSNDKDSSASCVAYWKKGDHKVLSINHTKQSYSQGTLKSNVNIDYQATIMILDLNDSGYTIQWTFNLPESIKKGNPLLGKSLSIYDGLKMIYKTTEVGAFAELSNWREVRDAYIKMMEMSLPPKLDSTAQAAINQSKELFNSKEVVESSLIREIQLFHSNYGYKFSVVEIKAETELPSPFADEPLPAIQTFKVSEINPGQDYFLLMVDQEIDKAGAAKFFEGFLKKMKVENIDVESETKKMLTSFEIKDHSEYKYVQSTGWIKQLSFTRSARSGEMNQVDSYTMKMVDDN